VRTSQVSEARFALLDTQEIFPGGIMIDDEAKVGDARPTGGRIVENANAYLISAFVIAFSVLSIIPMWAYYGVLMPHDGGHGHAHGGGEVVTVSEFATRTARFEEEARLPDGSVKAGPDSPVYVVAEQYTFRPRIVRLTAGQEYELQMMSTDVVHAFSIQMGDTSYNAVVMPKMITTIRLRPVRPGTYLVVCSEYCGIGHDYMHFSIIVEDGKGDAEQPTGAEGHETMSEGVHGRKPASATPRQHGGH
jgi:cytochrome c oxidase subunit II